MEHGGFEASPERTPGHIANTIASTIRLMIFIIIQPTQNLGLVALPMMQPKKSDRETLQEMRALRLFSDSMGNGRSDLQTKFFSILALQRKTTERFQKNFRHRS